jgi:hypothetical protein
MAIYIGSLPGSLAALIGVLSWFHLRTFPSSSSPKALLHLEEQAVKYDFGRDDAGTRSLIFGLFIKWSVGREMDDVVILITGVWKG